MGGMTIDTWPDKDLTETEHDFHDRAPTLWTLLHIAQIVSIRIRCNFPDIVLMGKTTIRCCCTQRELSPSPQQSDPLLVPLPVHSTHTTCQAMGAGSHLKKCTGSGRILHVPYTNHAQSGKEVKDRVCSTALQQQ